MSEDARDRLSLESLRRLLTNCRRTMAEAWKDGKKRVIATCLIAVVTAVIPLIEASLFGVLLNGLTSGASFESLKWWVVAVIAVGTLVPVLFSLRYFLERRNWYALCKLSDLLVVRKKAALDLATYESNEAQDIFMLYQQEGAWRIANFVNGIPNLCWNAMAAGTALVVLLFGQAWLCLPIFLGTLPVLLVELWSGEAMWGIFHARGATKRRFWHLSGCFQSSSLLGELKTYQNGAYFVDLLHALFSKFEREELDVETKKLIFQICAQIFYQLVYAFVLFTLIYQVVTREIQVGTFTFLLAAVGTYRSALSGFFGELGKLRDNERFVNNIWKLLDLKPKLVWKETGPKLDEHPLDIVFDDVTAGYPEMAEPLFKGLSLTIKQGERVAIVGPNGSGKTTLRRLLQRDFDPSRGRIMIGSHELRSFDEGTLYSFLAFLSQDTNYFHFTAKEVIGLGYTFKAPIQERIRHAAVVGGAATFIEDGKTLPSGYDQLLGKPDGSALSGGQWRRMAISRATYRLNVGEARILVMDEPTAQVDGDGAAKLFKALREDTSGRTMLLMTHQLADIKAIADRIIVLSHGRVVEDGTHEELMKREGTYYDLFKYQAKGYPAS